jgi:hypothetical protein
MYLWLASRIRDDRAHRSEDAHAGRVHWLYKPTPPTHTRGNTLPFLGVRFVAYNKNPNNNAQALQGRVVSG